MEKPILVQKIISGTQFRSNTNAPLRIAVTSHKLHLFELIFVLIADGNLHDDDIAFSKVVHSRRTPLVLLSTKTDDDLDAESRETHQEINDRLKEIFIERARNVFSKMIHQKAQVLADIEMLYVSAPVIRDQLNGNTSYLLYKVDEDRLLELVALKPGCHYALENSLRKQVVFSVCSLSCKF
uniref:Septin-type G domain-containing protein n=1 Tax=Ascaris lumbricoides TaxID=6252 RepID=A0A0M3ISW1_ASCLU